MLRRLFGFSIILVGTLACSRDDTASAKTRNGARPSADAVPPRPAVIARASQPYRVIPVPAGGALTGIVEFEGAAPVAGVIRPTVDENVCGNSIVERNVRLAGPRVGGAVVWITDIRSGKAFPLERRFELNNTNCTLDPYVQAIATGGTLNVGNDDRLVHTNRFINVGTGEVVGIAPFNDDGEVVPLDVFKEPAQIEVVSDRHPWTRAWIAVLDHPYYAQTAASGVFSIEGIPPGRYLVRAWHPSLGVADDSVTVPAGQQVNVAFRLRPKPSATGEPAPRPPSISEPVLEPIAPAASSTPTSSSTPTMIGPPPPR
jgi:carboxypeptidase family protein